MSCWYCRDCSCCWYCWCYWRYNYWLYLCQDLPGSWELDVSDNGLRTWNLNKTWSTCYSTRCKASMKRRKGREFTEEKLRGIDKGRDRALYSLVGDKAKAK